MLCAVAQAVLEADLAGKGAPAGRWPPTRGMAWRPAWRPPWRGSGARSWRATREFARSAPDAEKHSLKLDPTCNSRLGPADRRKEGALNKRRQGESVLRGGLSEVEAAAREINAQPWEPPPGMVKRWCEGCRYWFAVPISAAETTSRCPDCARLGSRPRYAALKAAHTESQTAFMATKFRAEELNKCVDNCFRPAVSRAGFRSAAGMP